MIRITASLIDVLASMEVKELVNLSDRFVSEPQCKSGKPGHIQKNVTLKIVGWSLV